MSNGLSEANRRHASAGIDAHTCGHCATRRYLARRGRQDGPVPGQRTTCSGRRGASGPHPGESRTEESYRAEWQDLPTRASRVRGMLVKQAMTSQVISVDENTDVLEAASIMLKKKVKRLPVTANGKLVGIISRIDICQAVLEDRL